MSFIKFHSKFRPKKHNSTTYHFSFKQPIKYKTSDNRGQKCWEKCWKQDYFSQIGCLCKIPSPLLPHSMLNEKFQPRATLYGGGGVWLTVLTRCLQTFKLNIRVFKIFSTRFVPDCRWRTLVSSRIKAQKNKGILSANENPDPPEILFHKSVKYNEQTDTVSTKLYPFCWHCKRICRFLQTQQQDSFVEWISYRVSNRI